METTTEKIQMSTLVECMADLLKDGFIENFSIKQVKLFSNKSQHYSVEEEKIISFYRENFNTKETGLFSEDGKRYNPDEVTIVNYYRFEGESDPGDNAILYAIVTSDGKKGMITDAYGPYSNSIINEFMQEVKEIHKKIHH